MKHVITALIITLTIGLTTGLTAQTNLTFPMPSFLEMPSGDTLRGVTTSRPAVEKKLQRIHIKTPEGKMFCYSILYTGDVIQLYQKCEVTDSLNIPVQIVFRYYNDGKIDVNRDGESLKKMQDELKEVIDWATQFNSYMDFMSTKKENEPSVSN